MSPRHAQRAKRRASGVAWCGVQALSKNICADGLSVREKDPNPSARDPGNHAVDDVHLADAARDNPTKTLSGQQGVERRVQRRRGHVHRITTAGVGRGVHKVESWHTARASNGIGPWGRRKRRLAVMSGGLPQFGSRSRMRQRAARDFECMKRRRSSTRCTSTSARSTSRRRSPRASQPAASASCLTRLARPSARPPTSSAVEETFAPPPSPAFCEPARVRAQREPPEGQGVAKHRRLARARARARAARRIYRRAPQNISENSARTYRIYLKIPREGAANSAAHD